MVVVCFGSPRSPKPLFYILLCARGFDSSVPPQCIFPKERVFIYIGHRRRIQIDMDESTSLCVA